MNGVSTDFSYDVMNRLATVKDNGLTTGANTTTYAYDDVGNLDSYSYPNSVATSYGYNSLNRLTALTVGNGPMNLASYNYTLGAGGNRLSVSEQGGRTVNYTYDSLYRLTNETISGTSLPSQNGSISYGYDALGNRLSRTSTLAVLPSTTNSYDENDRLITDSYDNNGNTIAASGTVYAYDFENRLTGVNGGSVSFVYDGDGNRVARTVNGVTTRYLEDTNNPTGYPQVVDEITGNQVTRTYTYGHCLISQKQLINSQWQVSFYGYDGQGSARLLTNLTGAITDTYTYDAFGTLITSTGNTPNDHLYAGEQLDPNLGFYYLRARYLNPSAGRFLTGDLFEGTSEEPQSLHKYLYAYANPINNVDPSGHFAVSVAEITHVQLANAAINTISIIALRAILTRIDEKFEELKCSEGGGIALYRSMKMDSWPINKPLVEQSARGLGVRVGGANPDITPDLSGSVYPNSGGMSVAPFTPMNLEPYRRPSEFGGTGRDPVWCINSIWIDVNIRLQFRQDSLTHGNLEPNARMSLQDYRDALADTKLFWIRVTKGLF